MGGQIRRFSPSANLSHKWLVICRNYCVEFSFFISAPYTRAHPWDFALFAFTTFTERDQKNVGVFLENVQRFSFFLRRFLKNVGRFYELLPTFLKVGCSLKIMGCCESHFFLFSVEKSLFSVLVCEGCESKKTQIPGNAPACHVRARKTFFLEQNMTLIMSAPSRRNSPRFLHPLL